jgi:hypothetical protein
MELCARDWKGESGAGLEKERESEGILGAARAEHLEVESERLGVLALLC